MSEHRCEAVAPWDEPDCQRMHEEERETDPYLAAVEADGPPPDLESVYVVKVAHTIAAIVADLRTADTFIVRYLALCWPKADPKPAESYQFDERREDYHAIPAGEYTGGTMLPVTVERAFLWTPDYHWPATSPEAAKGGGE